MKWKKLLSGILTGALLFTSVSPVSLAAETDDTGNGTASVPVAVAEYRFEDNLYNSMAENDAAVPITTGLKNYSGTPTYVEGRTEGSKAIKLGDFGLQLNKKNLGKNFTVSAWFKADGTFAENQTLMFLGYHNPEKWISIAGNKSGTDQLKVWTSEGTQGAEFYRWITLNNPTLKAGEWHCITLTQSDNDNTVKTYIDGELYNTSRGAYALDGENQDIYIAVNNWDAEFAGAVDDVKVYDQTLTDTEVYKYCYDVKISNQALTTYDFDDFAAKADDAATLSDGTRDISLVTVGNGQAPSLTTDSDRGQVLQTVRQGTGDNGLNNIGYAQLPSNPFEKMDTSNGLTLNFWANTQGAAGGNRCMIDFEIAPATTGRAGTFAFNQSMVYWNTTDQDGKFADYNVGGLGLSTANTWKMVTMTLTGDEIAFYSNGQKINHTVSSGSEDLATLLAELTGNSDMTPEDGTKIRLGASMAKYWIGAGALLDDISFFGKALTAAEVAQLYDETATSELATGITISSDDATVNVDKTMQLTATLEPSGATGASMVSWKSSNEKVATVDRNGLLTALAAGTTTITASIGGLVSNELTITVESIPDIDSLEEGYYLAVYTTTTPFYTGNYSNTDQETQSVYFAVSKDGKTFDVLNNGGGVIFAKEGTLKITEPKVFKENGTFTVIARDADKSQGYHEFTSTDGVNFYDESMMSKASQTSGVLTPSSFKLMLDGENLLDTDTNLTLGNAVELTEKEYTYIVNKLGTVVNNGLEALEDKTIRAGDTLTEEDLAESYPTATATYTDGSTQNFNIDWSGALDGVDLSAEGTYTVTGKVVQTKYLNNLKELNGSTLPEDDPDNENTDYPTNYDPDTKTVYYDETKFVEGMADPFIFWDEQTGYYYMTGSYFPEDGDEIDASDNCQQYDRVVLRRGKTLEELQDRSKQVTIWKVGNQGYEDRNGTQQSRGYRYIWAPEIHRVGDNWVVYFTESQNSRSLFGIYCHALVLPGDQDPYETALKASNEASQWKDYQMRGGTGLTNAIVNSFCLDMTYFKDEVNGESYVIWASTAYGNSSLYMAKVNEEKPYELTSNIVLLTQPEYGWERIRNIVNEGATVLQKDGTIYLCFSVSGTGSMYSIGMLTAEGGSDLLADGAWTKTPYPLLTSRDVSGEEGPGHNSFTVDKDGNVIFVYHARPTSHNYQMCGWDGTKSTYNSEPLNDPCRHARLKRVHWASDGTPILKMTYDDELLEENETISLTITVKEKEEPSEPSVTSITVKTAPEKTEYKIGEELDLSGIVIEAAYDDGTKKEIDIKDCTVTGFDNTKAGTQKITVTYEEQTTIFEVTVKEPSVTSITVKTAPEKTEYKIGEELDLTGIVIEAAYDDGTKKEIDIKDCTVTGFDNTKAGTQKITVTYEEQTVTFEVTVKEPSVTSITVKTAPEKTEYKIGEELDLTGIVIEAAYDDGTKKEIDIKDCTVTGFDNTKAGTQKITVTYEEQTVTFEVTVKEPSVTSITVKTAPEKTEYKIGEELDLTGIVIEAAYDDGTKKEIDIKDCTVTGFDNTKAGTQKITVTYEEQTVTFEVTVTEASKPDDANKKELEKAIENAAKLEADDYTADSWEAFQEALNKAQAIRDKEDATQKEIDDAVATLDKAAKALESKELPYVDVVEDDWFYNAAYYNYFAGTMTGTDPTHFSPYATLVRAQFATILYRLNGEPKVEYEAKFPDVPDGQFYSKAVTWAADAKVVTGYTDSGYFGTNDPITREQMVVMMYRYADYKKYDISKTAELSSFSDAEQVSGFAETAMKWAVENGIIEGKENTDGTYRLDPQGSTSRAECAIIIQRFMETFGD